MAIPILATLRPLTFLFDSVVFRTGIACLVVVGAVSSPPPYLHARRRFHSLSMSGKWTAPLGKMLLIRNRSKQTACPSHGTRRKSRERHNRTPTSDMFVEV